MSTPNFKKLAKKAKSSPLRKMVPKGLIQVKKDSMNNADLVLVETVEPGIAIAYAVKGKNKNKPAFVHELVKAIQNNEEKVNDVGISSMSYRKRSPDSDDCLLDNGYPVRQFIKYLADDDTRKEDTVQFGKDIAKVLNTFEYKYDTRFEFGGDITGETIDIAAHKLLSRDIKAYCWSCYSEHIDNQTLFEDNYLMESLFPNEEDIYEQHFSCHTTDSN